jgi:hypothetical protein
MQNNRDTKNIIQGHVQKQNAKNNKILKEV